MTDHGPQKQPASLNQVVQQHRKALSDHKEPCKGRLIELVPGVAYEYRCDTCHERLIHEDSETADG